MKLKYAQSSALPLPEGRFNVILADPPWSFKTYSNKGKGKGAEQHYNTMTLEQIKAMPVKRLAKADCVLLLWVTFPLLQEGIETMKAWGFEYKTCAFAWMKKNSKSKGLFAGMGYYTRANVEICLLGTRGSPNKFRKAKNIKQAILSRRREHSRKPDCVHQRIEKLFKGPYVELFARTPRDGWVTWGNQTQKFES
jgi:N6-adenosine-specific RNA methylase IME4